MFSQIYDHQMLGETLYDILHINLSACLKISYEYILLNVSNIYSQPAGLCQFI